MSKINREEYEILKDLDSKWKWIARDENSKKSTFPNQLWLYEYKPKKGPIDWLGGGGATKRFRYDNLFQFIQWEDEKPYNIQELIDEYEKECQIKNARIVKLDASKLAGNASDYKHFYKRVGESEETEMKKNIEWLRRKVLDNKFMGHTIHIDVLFELMDELDEPEVLSQEFIESNSVYASSDGVTEEYVHVDDLQNLLVPTEHLGISQELKKVQIPQFVADWIEEMKQDERPLYSVMSSLMNKTNHEWAVWKSAEKNFSEVVAKAWVDGYEVAEEREQKYRVMDRNTTLLGGINGMILTTAQILEYYPEYNPTFELTEQEIKDYDERYFAFAVKVEEVEG